MTARTLALDVSGEGGGAALLLPGREIVRLLPAGVPRGKDLVPTLQALLAEGGLSAADLDLVACGVGPVSFTGIRIAVTTAATFAHAAGLPALGVGSLHGRAANAPEDADEVLVILDGRRGGLFGGLFRGKEPVGDYEFASPEEWAARLSEGAWVLGEGRTLYSSVFDRFEGFAEAPPRPEVIGKIAAARFAAGARAEPARLRPLYLRPSEPELRRRERESGDS